MFGDGHDPHIPIDVAIKAWKKKKKKIVCLILEFICLGQTTHLQIYNVPMIKTVFVI